MELKIPKPQGSIAELSVNRLRRCGGCKNEAAVCSSIDISLHGWEGRETVLAPGP